MAIEILSDLVRGGVSAFAEGGGGGSTPVHIGVSPPTTPSDDALWWDSENGVMKIYYNDGSSQQWVDTSTGAIGPQGEKGEKGEKGDKGDPGEPAEPSGSYFGATQIFKPDVGGVIGNMLTAQASTQTMVAGREDISPFVAAFDLSIDLAYVSISNAATGASIRVVIYASDTNGRPTGAPTLSSTIDSTSTGTKSAGMSYAFEAGKMYWLGVRLGPTGTPTLRVAQPYAHYALAWNTASTPARSAVLRRTIGIDDTTDYPAFSNSLITAASTPMVLMRISA